MIITIQKNILKFFTEIILGLYRINENEVLDSWFKKILYYLEQNKNLLIIKSLDSNIEKSKRLLKKDLENEEFWLNHIEAVQKLKEKTIAIIQDNNSFYDDID